MARLYKKASLQATPKRYCRDCAHSYDWHDKGHDGQMILCRCPFDAKKEYGKYSKLLSDKECVHFKIRLTD